MGGSSNSGLNAAGVGSEAYMAATQAAKDQEQRQNAQARLRNQAPGGGYAAQGNPYLGGIYGAGASGGMQNPYKKKLQEMKDQYTGNKPNEEEEPYSGSDFGGDEDFSGGDDFGGGW